MLLLLSIFQFDFGDFTEFGECELLLDSLQLISSRGILADKSEKLLCAWSNVGFFVLAMLHDGITPGGLVIGHPQGKVERAGGNH